MHIISWNINGVRASIKKDFFESIRKMAPDIICLQETKAQNNEVLTALSPITEYHLASNAANQKGYSGTATLSKIMPISVIEGIGIEEHDLEGRVQCSEYDAFYLVNVYVPNSGQKLDRLGYRKQWDIDFLRYLKKLENKKPVLICGDFNVAHKAIDLKNDKANYDKTSGYTQVEISGMDNFIKAGFIDAFRYLHPDEVAYTYWSYRFKSRERNTGWRIDYFLVSPSLVDKIKEVRIYQEIMGSDHCPIGLEIQL